MERACYAPTPVSMGTLNQMRCVSFNAAGFIKLVLKSKNPSFARRIDWKVSAMNRNQTKDLETNLSVLKTVQ